MSSPMPIRRGDVIVAEMEAGEQPVLVVSPDTINDYASIILVAPITSERTDRVYPFEVMIEPPDGGLEALSKASMIRLRSIEKSKVRGYRGRIGQDTLRMAEEALKIATGLTQI